MGVIIGVYNRKGGVGKTTCAINLAAAFAMNDSRVLLIDGDSQTNTTKFLFSEDAEVFQKGRIVEGVTTIYDCIAEQIPIMDNVRELNYNVRKRILGKYKELNCTFYAIPGSKQLKVLSSTANPDSAIPAFKGIKHFFDYTIIDFPPVDDCLTTALLVNFDYTIAPLILAEEESTDGYADMLVKCKEVREELGATNLKPLGAFFNKAMLYKSDQNAVYKMSMKDTVKNALKLFETPIKFDYGANGSSKDERIPIVLNSYGSDIAKAYMKLSEEIAERLEEER